MKMLSGEVKNLLDKLYNLRGEDSVILTKMNKEREEALETGERTKNEKSVLLEKIEELSLEEKTLQEEGEKLTSVLSSINRDDFATVLDRLQIDFDPSVINQKLNTMLPATIDKLVSEKKEATEKLENVEAEMNNAITKVEELEIRKEEALNNQAKLNEYFTLALDGNINITRDAITNLLEKFDFTEDEQRETAKILMFPEDALYEYDASKKSSNEKSGKSITDVLVEAKKESKEESETVLKEEVVEEQPKEPEIVVPEEAKLEDIFDKKIEENVTEEIPSLVSEEPASLISEEKESLFQEEDSKLSFESPKNEKDELIDLLNSLEVKAHKISEDGLKKVLASYDEELIKTNVNALKTNEIDLDIIKDIPEVLVDKELVSKLEKLLSIGKLASDINLMPAILVKYNLQGLTNTINVLQISGLDPKKVPLMAY